MLTPRPSTHVGPNPTPLTTPLYLSTLGHHVTLKGPVSDGAYRLAQLNHIVVFNDNTIRERRCKSHRNIGGDILKIFTSRQAGTPLSNRGCGFDAQRPISVGLFDSVRPA
jgi:hypothetical protein